MEHIRNKDKVCPHCGGVNLFTPYSSYERTIISFQNSKRNESVVKIPRYKCSCGRTHALLPDILIPFSSYSLRFIITLLWKFLNRKCSVQAFCEEHCIAISTLYKWIHTFTLHYNLFADALNKISNLTSGALTYVEDDDTLVRDFFTRFRFSFMQQHRIATHSDTGTPPPVF